MGLIAVVSRRLAVASAVAALAVLGAWVPSAVASTLTKAQYIAQADALCGAADRRIVPLSAEGEKFNLAKPAHGAKYARILDKAFVIEKDALAKIRALPKPPSSAGALTKIWNALASDVAITGKTVPSFKHLNLDAIKRDTTALAAAQGKYIRLAQAYGFKVCGRQEAAGS